MILKDSTTRDSTDSVSCLLQKKKIKKLKRSIIFKAALSYFYSLPFSRFRLYNNHNAQPSVFAESFFS